MNVERKVTNVPKEPKTTLNQLLAGFADSAGDETLTEGERRLAARLCILTRYVQILAAGQADLGKLREQDVKDFDKGLAELIEMVKPVLMTGNAPPAGEPTPSDDDEAAAMVAQVEQEAATEAEAAASNGTGAVPTEPVTVPNKAPRKAIGKKASPAGNGGAS